MLPEGNKWLYKNKEHGMTSAAASLGALRHLPTSPPHLPTSPAASLGARRLRDSAPWRRARPSPLDWAATSPASRRLLSLPPQYPNPIPTPLGYPNPRRAPLLGRRRRAHANRQVSLHERYQHQGDTHAARRRRPGPAHDMCPGRVNYRRARCLPSASSTAACGTSATRRPHLPETTAPLPTRRRRSTRQASCPAGARAPQRLRRAGRGDAAAQDGGAAGPRPRLPRHRAGQQTARHAPRLTALLSPQARARRRCSSSSCRSSPTWTRPSRLSRWRRSRSA